MPQRKKYKLIEPHPGLIQIDGWNANEFVSRALMYKPGYFPPFLNSSMLLMFMNCFAYSRTYLSMY